MNGSDIREFVGPVRTIMTTILGFSEMLSDPALALSEERRREYEVIVLESSALLSEHIERQMAETPPSRAA